MRLWRRAAAGVFAVSALAVAPLAVPAAGDDTAEAYARIVEDIRHELGLRFTDPDDPGRYRQPQA